MSTNQEKKKLSLNLDHNRAEKNTQVLVNRSTLEYSEEVKQAQDLLSKDPKNPELWMKKGLALAKQMLCVESTEAFSIGLSYDPFNWLLFRHRGHRQLSTWRFADAAADFEFASRIKQDDWDIWYHLGLSYYLIGDFTRAASAYNRCLALTDPVSENLVAIVNWEWLTLMRLDRKDDAKKVLEYIDADTEAGENQAYKDMVLTYKGLLKPEKALEFDNPEFEALELATRGYGIAMFYYFNAEKQKAKVLLNKIFDNDAFWSAFGYLATLQELRQERLVLS